MVVLFQLRASGYRVALLTEGRHHASRAAAGMFDLEIAPDSVTRRRPFPDVYLAAFVRLGGVSVNDLVIVGSSAPQMAAGRRAAAEAVVGVVQGAETTDALRVAGATDVIECFAELPAVLGLRGGVVEGDAEELVNRHGHECRRLSREYGYRVCGQWRGDTVAGRPLVCAMPHGHTTSPHRDLDGNDMA